jgi:uncharacterized protein YdeI (YjbR/CyaY-like superfamily)
MTPTKRKTHGSSTPKSFATVADFRAWLETHHKTTPGLILRCFKTHARDRGIGYFDALDEALAFGWIDGVRRRLDEVSFTQRFTPRRRRSKWSAVNIRRFKALQDQGRVHRSGLAAFEAREHSHRIEYSYESKARDLNNASLRTFTANPKAWRFYQSQPPWYRRVTAFWVMSAKRDETRARRLDILIKRSASGQGVPQVPATARPATSKSARLARR